MRIFNITSLMSYSLAPLEPSVRHYWQRFGRKKEILSVFARSSRFWFLVIEKNRLAVLFQKFLQIQFHLHQIAETWVCMLNYICNKYMCNIHQLYKNSFIYRYYERFQHTLYIHYTYMQHTLYIHKITII